MALSYNVTALPHFVDQNKSELIGRAVLGAKSTDIFGLMTGVKGDVSLNLIDTTVEFGDGSTCGWNEAGESKLSQRILSPAPIKVNMSICDKVLLDKYANYLVKVEANKTDADLPFEKEFADSVVAGVNKKLEEMIWTGTKGPGAFDGIDKIEAAGMINADGDASAYNTIKNVAAALPANVLAQDDVVIACGFKTYNAFIQELVAANLYHYNPANGDNGYVLPGTNIKVVAVPGISDGKVYGFSQKNVVYGVNMIDGQEVFDLWYSKDNREFRLAIEFVAGVQVAFPDEMVYATVG